jgi:fumarate reductase (CoM/CoB) subunit B
MKFKIQCGQGEDQHERTFDYVHDEEKRPMALDVLLQAKATTEPDLAFRYGCRNELCGVCTIDVNGEPRLACRSRVNEGDTLSALSTLPQLRDLVVAREHINKQLQRVSQPAPVNQQEIPSVEISSLNQCIECYGCLSGCPMHQRNDAEEPDSTYGFRYGNPYTLLKLRRAMLEPTCGDDEKNSLLNRAVDLGLDSCLDCDGCKCQVGIGLVSEVVEPLLSEAAASISGF